MPVASAPPYPDRVVVQQIAPTRSVADDSPPTYEDSANPNSELILIIIFLVLLEKILCDPSTLYHLIFRYRVRKKSLK